ncbi:unnamed protein product, partial [Ectocarpus sp. 12 AP-2014]
PHLVVRCARHYERAAAVVVSAAVRTASLFVELPPARWGLALPVGACVTSRAAARIDLAGGWTDTPPISYEAGGAVLNAAVTVSGEKPIEARCERIEAASVELVCVGREGTVTSRTVCSSLEDFS